MFEVYRMNDDAARPGDGRRSCATGSARSLPNYDLVVVADYGHGMLIREGHRHALRNTHGSWPSTPSRTRATTGST